MNPKSHTTRKKGNTSSKEYKVTYWVEIPKELKEIKEENQSELIRSELRFILKIIDKYEITPKAIIQIQADFITKYADEKSNKDLNLVIIESKKKTTSRIPMELQSECKENKIPLKKTIEKFQKFSLRFQAIHQQTRKRKKVDVLDLLCGERMTEHFEYLYQIGHIKKRRTKIFGLDIGKRRDQ